MDIIRQNLAKAKSATRDSSRALRQNAPAFLSPPPSLSNPPGPLNPNRAQPTKRTTIPAFIHAQDKIKEEASDDPVLPVFRGRGRGVPTARSFVEPPSYSFGRGIGGLESLEKTTLASNSVASDLSVGLGRGRGRSRGRVQVPEPPGTSAGQQSCKFFYSQFSFDRHVHDAQNLPIMDFREQIVRHTHNHTVTLIQGDTGCGKSTQVPQFLLDDAVRRNVPCNIIVTQPRRIAAISLAKRVCDEREWEIGTLVGYQVGLKREADQDKTCILYVTDGVFVEKLIHGRGLNQWSHIILDEVHERSQDMDLCLLLVRQLMREERPNTRLILMSASADINRLAEYFATLEVERSLEDPMFSEDEFAEERELKALVKPPVVAVAGRLFDVSIFYMEQIDNLFHEEQIECPVWPPHNLTEDPFFLEHRIRIIKELILYFDALDIRKVKEGLSESAFRNRGSVLVFLPGIAEISQVHDFLVGYNQHETILHESTEELRHKWTIIPLHSVISTEKQRKIFDPPPKGHRKIILSTNIAESSITVPDISYVIDLCLTKRLRRDTSRSNFSSLNVEWASKSNCQQRAGRAGRIAEGKCYRLVESRRYDDFESHCPAEIQIAPLEQVILRVKLFDRNPKEMLDQAMDKPSFEDFGHSILTLKEVGALTVVRRNINNEEDWPKVGGDNVDLNERINTRGGCMVYDGDYLDGDLTFVGKLISSLPVDVHVGKMIALGYAFGVLKDAIVVGAGLAGSRSIFKQPFQGEAPQKVLDSYERRLHFSAASASDCFAVRNAYYAWKAFMNSGGDRGRETDLQQWCSHNQLDRRALYDMDALIAEIENRLLRFNIRKPPSELPNLQKDVDQEVKDFMLQLVIAGAFYPNYFLRAYNHSIENSADRILDGRSPHYCVELGNLPVERGMLYHKQLVTMFKSTCMRRAPEACKPKVHFHDSKAVVDFSAFEIMERMKRENSMIRPPSRAASLPVYLALKMRQIQKLRPYITVVNETDRLHVALDHYRKQTRLKYEVESEIQAESRRLTYDKHIGFPGLHTSRIKLKITFVHECCHFFGIYVECWQQYLQLKSEIENTVRNHACPPVPVSDMKPGLVCLAPRITEPSSASQKEFFRVRLDTCDSRTGSSTWLVSFLDVGGTQSIASSKIHCLPEKLSGSHFPYLAIECFVANVGPHSVYRASGEFTSADGKLFSELLKRESRLHGSVGMTIYSLVSVQLHVILDVSLGQLEEHALEYREELMPSRTDHLERLKAQRIMRSEEPATESAESLHRREARLRAIEQEEEKLMRELEESVLQSGTIKRQKINLVGPSHPYEMRFVGMTSCSSSRSVSIAGSSINSIILDDQPQCHLDRLLVASLVHSSMTRSLSLLETTLMPNLAGLPSLLALIFAPVAELRVNEERTRYTGALCGLGFDECGRSLHPNNDMEVTFDIQIDDKVLLHVNKIRLGINLILTDKEWEDARIGHHEKVVAELQQKIREDVVDLFLKAPKPRHLVNSCYNDKAFSWCVLAPSAFLNPALEVRRQLGAKALYQVHYRVAGVDKGGMANYLRERKRTESLEAPWLPCDPMDLQEYRPRWETAMHRILDDLTAQVVRSVDISSRELAATKELDHIFVCELCLSRPDGPVYGFVCTTVGAVAEHLRTEEHKEAEKLLHYSRCPQLQRILSLLNR